VTEQPPTPEPVEQAAGAQADGQIDAGAQLVADRPEIVVGAALAGGFLFAMILRRLAR
jgi:hypothetical protein